MNAYYYAPADVGLTEFPPGYFRLGGWEATTDPASADCFVLPTDIRHVSDKEILQLPHLKGNEARHVFFSLSEFPQRMCPILKAMGFRTDYNAQLRDVNPNFMAWCWGVEDLERYVPVPEGGFAYDVHAQMWASTPLTDAAVESCLRAGLVVRDQRNPFFYGTLETNGDERLGELRTTFLESMSRSRVVLVPRSRPGVNRYRFFEAMSMGRVPMLLCDDVELPFPELDEWNHCVLRVWEGDVRLAGIYLKEWLSKTPEGELIERGAVGRELWARCFKNEAWERVWGDRVRVMLKVAEVARVLA